LAGAELNGFLELTLFNSLDATPNAATAADGPLTTAALLARKMKNPATPPRTLTMMTSKLKMPQFIPAAIAESDWP